MMIKMKSSKCNAICDLAEHARIYGKQLHLWHMVILPSSINIHFARAPIIRLQIWFIKKNYHHFVCSSVGRLCGSHTHRHANTCPKTGQSIKENWYKFLPNVWRFPLSLFYTVFDAFPWFPSLCYSQNSEYFSCDVVYDCNREEIHQNAGHKKWDQSEFSKKRWIW